MVNCRAFYRLAKWPPQILCALGLGPLIGRLILLLTTTGRKSGRPRVTPLQYEIERRVGAVFYTQCETTPSPGLAESGCDQYPQS